MGLVLHNGALYVGMNRLIEMLLERVASEFCCNWVYNAAFIMFIKIIYDSTNDVIRSSIIQILLR